MCLCGRQASCQVWGVETWDGKWQVRGNEYAIELFYDSLGLMGMGVAPCCSESYPNLTRALYSSST